MAYSSAQISAADLALLAADKPVLSTNAIRSAIVEWRIDGSFDSGVNATDPSYPGSRIYDGKTHVRTRATTTASDISLMIDTGTDGIEFDFFSIIGHNFGDSSTNVTYTLQISNNSDFSLNVVTLAASTFIVGNGNPRIIDMSLFHTGSVPLRYSGVQYIRIRLQSVSLYKFEIGELILGRRRQLKRQPNIPWDDYALGSLSDMAVSMAGVITKYSRNFGGRRMAATFNPHETQYINDFKAWWEDIDYGARSFVWIDKPGTAPGATYLMHIDATNAMLGIPLVGPIEREISIASVEQGPDFYALEH